MNAQVLRAGGASRYAPHFLGCSRGMKEFDTIPGDPAPCILGCRAWVVVDATGADSPANILQGAWLVGTHAEEGDPPKLVGRINIRFEIHLAPSPGCCAGCTNTENYKVTAKYKNHNDVDCTGSTYPAQGITRLCSNGWHRFDPGWNGSDAWRIVDDTISWQDILGTMRGTIEITVEAQTPNGHTHAKTFTADVSFIGGLDARIVIVSCDSPFNAKGGEYSLRYETAEWDSATLTMSLQPVWSNIDWTEGSETSSRQTRYPTAAHTEIYYTFTGNGGKLLDEDNPPRVTVTGTVVDQFGRSTNWDDAEVVNYD
ncbi:MAG: hypothetical protein Kow00107_01110 [Planctomycetota bacterium]